MGFFRFIFTMIVSWMALKIVRGLFMPSVGKSPDHQPLNNAATKIPFDLDLVACPVCGVYTTLPCANCAKQA